MRICDQVAEDLVVQMSKQAQILVILTLQMLDGVNLYEKQLYRASSLLDEQQGCPYSALAWRCATLLMWLHNYTYRIIII